MVRRRATSLTNHDNLSMDAFCVPLVQRTGSETWPTFSSQHPVILLGAAVHVGLMSFNALCAVVQLSVGASQPSMMHVEGSTVLKIALRLKMAMAALHHTIPSSLVKSQRNGENPTGTHD